MNGGYVSKTFYVDKTPSEITGFTFSANKSVPNKLLSFLTFGIYRNDSINVEVTASDNASGVGSIMLYGDGEPKTVNIKNGDNSAVFTLKNQLPHTKFMLAQLIMWVMLMDTIHSKQKIMVMNTEKIMKHLMIRI